MNRFSHHSPKMSGPIDVSPFNEGLEAKQATGNQVVSNLSSGMSGFKNMIATAFGKSSTAE